jgi:biotin-(acetyl-CoA carboxylase) ligase
VSRITEDIINCINGEHFDWINAWKKSCVHIGKNAVNANDTENNIIGTFHDIDSQGNAIVMTRNGIKSYSSGEIKIEGIY